MTKYLFSKTVNTVNSVRSIYELSTSTDLNPILKLALAILCIAAVVYLVVYCFTKLNM